MDSDAAMVDNASKSPDSLGSTWGHLYYVVRMGAHL